MGNQKRKRISIMNINWKLPEDIVKVIFSKLPFFNLPNCRIVCKAWNHLILDYANSSTKFLFLPNIVLVCTYDIVPTSSPSNFYNTFNPKIHCFDFDTINSVATLGFDVDWKFMTITSSCNGLLQITNTINDIVANIGILNPMTNEFIELSIYEDEFYSFGFGFSPKRKQYKLFRTYEDDDKLITKIEVWRFGITNELQQWKPLSSHPFSFHNHGTYLDGVIYWIGKDITNEFVIYGLDVETEIFETVAILDVGPYSARYHSYFQQFNATTYLIIKMEAPLLEMQVWKMRSKHSWIKEFVFDISNDDMLIDFIEGDFIKADEGGLFFYVNNDLFYFDKTGKKIKIKTLFNPNETKVHCIWHIEYFHFGSLPMILAGYN